MFKTSLRTFATALALSFATLPAQAALYDFSYTTGAGNIISGQITGDVQADGNTILVSAATGRFDGGTVLALPFAFSTNLLLGLPVTNPAFVTVDGSVMDLLACATANCDDAFALDTVNLPVAVTGVSTLFSGPSFGSLFEPYDSGRWSLAVTSSNTSSVPEPTSLALMGLGLGLLVRRRKAA